MTSALLLAAAAKKSSSSSLIFIVIIVAFGAFLLLSTRKRKANAQQMQSALNVGSRIMTTAGLFATVVSVDDEGVVLEVAPGVHSKYARQAISRVLDAPEGAEPLDDDDAGDSSIDLNKEPPANS